MQSLAHLHQPETATIAEVAAEAREANAGMVVLTSVADDSVAAAIQVSEARAAGLNDVVAGREGLMLELPIANREINVRPL